MRLVGCLLLPTDIRACLYEPGMREGRVQGRIEPGPWARQAHHTGQSARPLVVVETSGRHRIVHCCYRLVRQHSHNNYSFLLKLVTTMWQLRAITPALCHTSFSFQGSKLIERSLLSYLTVLYILSYSKLGFHSPKCFLWMSKFRIIHKSYRFIYFRHSSSVIKQALVLFSWSIIYGASYSQGKSHAQPPT